MKALFLLFNLIFFYSLNAQVSNLKIELQGGVVIGSPYGEIPDNVIEFDGAPSIKPTLRLLFSYPLIDRLSITAGLGYAEKGNTFSTTVEDKYDVTRGIFGENFPIPLNVKYTAWSEGSFYNKYFDFPAYLTLRLGQFRLMGGYQYSRLLSGNFGGTVDVKVLLFNLDTMEYDESEQLKNTDHALLAGFGFEIVKNLVFSTQCSYGLSYIFEEAPEGMPNMKNIYGMILLGYEF